MVEQRHHYLLLLFNYNFDGYDAFHIVRSNRKGGCVVIYIKNTFNGRICESKSMVVDDVFECVTVAFGINRNKTALVSCVYMCPGSNIICFNCQSGTKQFIDLMYNIGLYPLIKRPSRITTTSATLIDNILTSEIECKIDSDCW